MKRIVEFEILRVMALMAILLCHFLRAFGGCCQLDMALGTLGNLVFFIMSGWLLGLGWAYKGRPILGIGFLKHRFLRLLVPLWLVAGPYFIYLWVCHCPIPMKSIVLNLTLLNWFEKVPGMTAYWFITAISVFYLCVVVFTRLFKLIPINNNAVFFIIVFVACIQIIMELFHIGTGYIFTLMLGGMVAFIYGEILVKKIQELTGSFKTMFFSGFTAVISFGVLWLGFKIGLYENGSSVAYWFGIIPALSMVVFVFSLKPNGICNIIKKTSLISFEIYLLHQIVLELVMGKLLVHPMLSFIQMLATCYCVAFLVNNISKRILTSKFLR